MARRFKDMTGRVFGDWTVVELSPELGSGQTAKWVCKCSCGTIKSVKGTSLRNGRSTSCGCRVGGVKPDGEMAYRKQYRSIEFGAKSRDLAFDLTYERYRALVVQPCHICGKEPYDKHYEYSRLRYSKGVHADRYLVFNGVDRLNSDIGYVEGNVASCCVMCNRMKSDFTTEQFYEQVVAIANNIKEKNNGRSQTKTSEYPSH